MQDAVDPAITTNDVINNNKNHQPCIEDQNIFHQYGAPPHCAVAVPEYLNDTYPGRWILRTGVVEFTG